MAVLMAVQLYMAPDLSMLAQTIDVWTMYVSGLYKWFIMTMFNDDFAKLRTDLTKIQAQGSAANGDSENNFMEKYIKHTKKMTMWYIALGLISVIITDGRPLIHYPKSGLDNYNDSKYHPFILWIPFEIKYNWAYIMMFTFQVYSSIIIVVIYMGIDSFMFGAIYNVSGEIELLKASINNIKNTISTVESTVDLHQLTKFTDLQNTKCYSMLKECIKHHILILQYIKKINTLFSSLIFIDYIHGTISMTFLLFQMTFSSDIGEIIYAMYYFGLSISHQYLNNYFGELIIQKQLSVLTPLSDVPWWRADKKVRVMLSLMMLRSMKPTMITGCSVYKLCHETFLNFSKGLYSYYMVLRRVNIENNN